MKKAKIILASVAILAILSGALAFNASRFDPAKQLWILGPGNKITSITVGGVICTTTIPNCTLTGFFATDVGTPVVTSTTSTRANVTTAFKCGSTFFITTYSFCAQIITPVTIDN